MASHMSIEFFIDTHTSIAKKRSTQLIGGWHQQATICPRISSCFHLSLIMGCIDDFGSFIRLRNLACPEYEPRAAARAKEEGSYALGSSLSL